MDALAPLGVGYPPGPNRGLLRRLSASRTLPQVFERLSPSAIAG